MKKTALIGLLTLILPLSASAGSETGNKMAVHHQGKKMAGKMSESELPAGGVSFVTPKDGAKISAQKAKALDVKFGVSGMEVAPAGMFKKHTGHHHLIIDGKHVPFGVTVPTNKTHLHFGKGQKETKVSLKPGKHTLTLQFADFMHSSYGKKFSKTITVTVE